MVSRAGMASWGKSNGGMETGNDACTSPNNKKRRVSKPDSKSLESDSAPTQENTISLASGNSSLVQSVEESATGTHNTVTDTPVARKRKRLRKSDVGDPVVSFPVDHDIHDPYEDLHIAMVTKKDELKELHTRCGGWKIGRWSADEMKLLLGNICHFCDQHNITNVVEEVLRVKDEKTHFYIAAAWGIRRPLFLIYRQIGRVFSSGDVGGKYSQVEISRLIELQEIHGNQWAEIGCLLDRSAQSVRDKFVSLSYTRGTWRECEEQALVAAVKEASGLRDDEDVLEDCPEAGINWQLVSYNMKTRTPKQCYKKWLHHMCWKEAGSEIMWSRDDDIRLVKGLSQLVATDEDEVAWGVLAASDWPAARSSSYLRSRWASLRRQLPNSEVRSFKENIQSIKRCIVLDDKKT